MQETGYGAADGVFEVLVAPLDRVYLPIGEEGGDVGPSSDSAGRVFFH